jgi:hypothetical protein
LPKVTSGNAGKLVSGWAKSNAEVRSPQVCRRQSLMFGSTTPVQVSKKRMMEVWSNTCEQTRPPRLQGETTNRGTRIPKPNGSPLTNSLVVPGGGTGGGTWSKNPPFSS